MNKHELKNSLDQIDRRFIDEALEPSVPRRRVASNFMTSPWGRLCAACLCVAVILTAALVLPGIAEYHRGTPPEPGHSDVGDSAIEKLEPTVSDPNLYEFLRKLPGGVTFYFPKKLPVGYSVVSFEYFTLGESAGQSSWVTVTYTDGTEAVAKYEHTITVETICYDSAENAKRVFETQYGEYVNSDGIAIRYSSGEDATSEAGDEIISSQPVRLAQLTWVAGDHFIVRMQMPAIQNMLDYIDMKYKVSIDGDGIPLDPEAQKAHSEMVSKMQLTEEQLALDTPQLLEAILDSDYLYYQSIFSSQMPPYIGYYSLWLRDLNGFAELETREDAVEALLAYYAKVHPNGFYADSWSVDRADVYVRTILAEGASGAFYASLTEEQKRFVGLDGSFDA